MYKPSILNVIENDYCVGCGACSLFSDKVNIKLNDKGYFQAYIDNELNNSKLLERMSRVCPFTDESKNEDEIASNVFQDYKKHSSYLGYYIDTYIGNVNEDDFRERGSSGGIGKWLAFELYRLGYVDKVIEVKQRIRENLDEPLYTFTICEDELSIKEGAKSAYYPIEMSGVLDYVRENPGKYLITGVPCFIKSIRLLQHEDPLIGERIKFTLGLVCGHLKSENYANMIGWQLGVHPDDISSLDFRKKLIGASAKQKGVEVKSISNPNYIKDDIVQNLFGTNYGHGFFKYKACDYCDDVVSETADATVGDAWLPEYVNDGKGNNVFIIRNKVISNIVSDAIKDNRINLDRVSEEEIIKSQDAGFRHRRDGLAYRLYLADKAEEWRPQKRVSPSTKTLTKRYKQIHKVRINIREQSHIQFKRAREKNDYSLFEESMKNEIKKLEPPLWRKVASKVKNTLKN